MLYVWRHEKLPCMRGVGRCTRGSLFITKKALFLPSVATNVTGFEQDAGWLLAVARVTTIKMKIVPMQPIEQNLFTSREREKKGD